MSGDITLQILTGAAPALADRLGDLARLRLEIFRQYPYLYAGNLASETTYVRTYLQCPESLLVLALCGDAVVGMATALPLAFETEAVKAPFLAAGIDPARVFYCGESVLQPAYRRRGVYRQFMAARENYARSLGRFDRISMCAVVRPPDHPRRPAGYVSLDAVWDHFGYLPRPDLVASFEWQDLDEPAPTVKSMVFREKML